MKKLCIFTLLIFLQSCYRYNPAIRANWAKNTEFEQQYGKNDIRLPMQNIPYIELYVARNKQYEDKEMQSRMTRYASNSYDRYASDLQEMRLVSDKIVNDVKTQAIKEQQNAKYIYNEEKEEYELDPSSIKPAISSPTLANRYAFNKRMGYKTSIPYKNAFEIISMRNKGYIPNAEYFQNMNVKYEKVKTMRDIEYVYPKKSAKEIYMMAGNSISEKVLQSAYGSYKTDD
ncbi:hypothetical protein [Candidatus Deianiraea vastatrix]|uniref:Lipoprotein n=1 Tax=Candidatus Deianiraea vastatrix TaxID=2163644 RepID=A0A5B8XHB7_9RICK|nr:hypothetical protein [Candidatus Deianiraea vastatrix]QED23501.1 hypothetical protein Deia_00710 [Candidatus Deianiraea vastatrix]